MITRRDFLKIGGVALTASGMIHPAVKALAAETASAHGRILTGAALHDAPEGTVITTLKPDSVQTILAYENGWVRLPDGFVAEQHIQPMLDANHLSVEKLPVWVEVIAPYAALRQWAQSEAPLMTRLGHGSVMQVTMQLDDAAGRVWLQADGGWLQMAHVQPVNMKEQRAGLSAMIDQNHLMLEHRGREVARFAISRPENLVPGEYRIETRAPGHHPKNPWQIITNGNFALCGTTIHNHLGRVFSGENVEMSVIAAKTVYAALTEGSKISIR